MKPLLELLPRRDAESFVVKKFEHKYFPTPWHYHAAYEIGLIIESSGKKFIGDSTSNFKAGDIFFLGSNLPHTFRNDETYYHSRSKKKARSIIIHFEEDSLGTGFLDLPEAATLKKLFTKSARGLDVKGTEYKKIHQGLFDLLQLKGLARWLKLLELLQAMASSKRTH